MDRSKALMGAVVGFVIAAGMGVGVGGCQQYSTYPAVPTAEGMSESPNKPATEAVMIKALQYVATHYPPGGSTYQAKTQPPAGEMVAEYPAVINLPIGMRRSYYERIAKKVGPNVQPMSENVVNRTDMPVFHVTRVWLRFNQGTVDVLRPMVEMGNGPDGKPVYQKVTLRFEGGFEPWRLVHARAWEPGTDAAPAPYLLPDVERVNQFEYSMKESEKAQAAASEPQTDQQ